MRILITEAAAFTVANLGQRIMSKGNYVVGVDSLIKSYKVSSKQAALARLSLAEGIAEFASWYQELNWQ